MQTLLQDLRYGFRMLGKNPGFAAVAILTLALGISANTAIFSVVDSVLLRPLPYSNPSRLVRVREIPPGGGQFAIAPGNYIDWTQQTKTLKLAAYQAIPLNLTGSGEPMRVRAARVSASLFSILGVQPMAGRTFLSSEDQEGRSHVVLVSYGLWKSRFGGESSLAGKTLNLDSVPYTVVGIMPRGFHFPEESEVWVPMAFQARERSAHGAHYLQAVARLAPGAKLDQARSEMDTLAGRLQQQYPDSNKGWGVRLTPLLQDTVQNIKTALWVLMAAVGFVLLIACANVANLLLARGAARQKEVAIRAALGANRFRMLRQLLTESLVLAVIGGVMGFVLAWGAIRLLIAFSPGNIPRLNEVQIDLRALIFNIGALLVTGLLFGLAPALHASRPDRNESLKEGGRTAQADHRGGARRILVVAEVALALVLLAGAGLLMKSFLRLEEVNLGFDPVNVLTLSIALPNAKYPKPQSQALFFQNLLEHVHAIHGVESAGAVTNLPLVLDWIEDVYVEGKTAQGQACPCNYYGVSPGYFRAMGIPLVKGRLFNARDDQQSTPVAVINQNAARRLFPNQDPIGKRIYVTNGPEIFREVVGVVADSKQYGADSPYTRQVFEPFRQAPTSQMALAIRTSVPPLSITGEVRNAVFSVDKDQPVADVQTMQELVSRSEGPRQFSVYLLGIFASLALVLATVGIYGLIAYSVSQRTHEIGLRMALGAKQGDVLRLVMRQGMVLAALGIGIGIAGALASARVLSGLLFEVRPTDPLTFVIVSGFLGGVALLACYIPARRAARVDPMIALRHE